MKNRPDTPDFKFIPLSFASPRETGEESFWCLFSGENVLVHEQSVLLPEAARKELFPALREEMVLGEADGKTYWVGEVDPGYPGELNWLRPRSLIGQLHHVEFEVLSRALQFAHWKANHQFCCRCGTPAVMHESERMMVCTACSYQQYPRVSPCIIVLIHRGDELLLARNGRFRKGFYSTLAGFIEAGESVEHALHREVMEEVGVEVDSLEYLGSQSWPFPHSLMLGFHARYAGGDICVDNDEITHAAWWKCDELPDIPPPGTISRYLIDEFIDRRRNSGAGM